MNIPENDLLEQIVSDYEIGNLTGFLRLTLGYVNTSYIITTTRAGAARKYLLRIYRQGIEEAELVFEHSIINHLAERSFDLTAAVLTTRQGKTYVHRSLEGKETPGEGDGIYCAIFEFLPGEDRFTWIRPECSAGELAESAIALARFHDAVMGLNPGGRRVEPAIMDLLPRIDVGIKQRLATPSTGVQSRRRDNVFENCLYENQEMILCAIDHLRQGIDPEEFKRTLHLVIHGDYHPGNLKFDGGKVVGLFDLDWSKVDARTFDLGLALTYFCASWDAEHIEDYFRLDRAAIFLRAYQTAAAQMGQLRPLDAVEIKYLPAMCAAGNIYVLEWALRDYFNREVEPLEYLGYLQHHLCLMRWYDDEDNRRKLEQMIADNMCPTGAAHTLSGGATP